MSQREESKQVFFKFYDDYAENYLEFMDGEQVKLLMMALVDYHKYGVVPEFDDKMMQMAFKVIGGNIDRDREKYLEKCEKNRQNALARQEALRELKRRAYGEGYVDY